MINKECVCEEIKKSRNWKMTQDNVITLAALLYIKEHCEKSDGTWEHVDHEGPDAGDGRKEHVHTFTRQMAMEWMANMVNADGTHGPHWTMEDTDKLHKQYALTCDKLEFWSVMNSLYSDYCEALRESSASTPEVYVCLAKAWINDKDAVSNKAAAYYTYIVRH